MSKETILSRVRAALADVPAGAVDEVSPVAWAYGRATPMPDVLERFIDTVEDYRATVTRVTEQDLSGAVADAVAGHGVRSVVVPSGTPDSWRTALTDAGVTVIADDPPLSKHDLNAVDAVVTGAAVGAAETGTIVLDHAPDQGRRALSLVPDVHVCVIREDQVVSDVPEAVARLHHAVVAGQPLTWISGGSATSDIELSRVEGVHGPRTLHVVLVGP